MREHLPEQDWAWKAVCFLALHVSTSGRDGLKDFASEGSGELGCLIGRGMDEKRSKRVRSWSGEALGRGSYPKNSPLKIIEYTYLRNRERNRVKEREIRYTKHTHTYIYLCAPPKFPDARSPY